MINGVPSVGLVFVLAAVLLINTYTFLERRTNEPSSDSRLWRFQEELLEQQQKLLRLLSELSEDRRKEQDSTASDIGGSYFCARRKFPFIVFSQQRSGTHWLKQLLEGYPEVKVQSELFDDFFLRLEGRVVTNETGVNQVLLANYYSQRADGFILHWNQAQKIPAILDVIQRGNFSIILLKRTHTLARYVSFYQQFNAPGKKAPFHCVTEDCKAEVASQRFTLPIQTLLATLTDMEKETSLQEETIRKLGLRSMTVVYEGLVKNTRARLCRMISFLSCSCDHIKSTKTAFVRVHDAPLSSVITNWDEVVKTLTGTPFEGQLAET